MDKQRVDAAQAPDWTPEEDATLVRMWKEGKTAKQILKELPGRTEPALRKRRPRLGLARRRNLGSGVPVRVSEVLIWKALRHRRGTRSEVAARAGVGRTAMSNFIKENRARIHIVDWKRSADGPYVEVFAAGAGQDAPRPAAMSRSEIYARYWERLKRERPADAAFRVSRDNMRRLEREGKLIRRDPAAEALFGSAARAA
ncbi:conserved hypothetical protein [Paraburkholderia caribensis]|nr:conserved hypothetical protein [Paraburkholderia caribensis]